MKCYKTIYADPPWQESGGGRIKRGADRHYPLMKTADICALPIIKEICANDCHCYLWVTNNHLPDGLKVLDAWGFRYITKITWNIDRIGLGQYFRGITEDCLFGVKGNLPYKVSQGKRQQGVTGFYAPKGRHSEKPELMRDMIEKVSYPPAIELFARRRILGWDCWGDLAGHELYAALFGYFWLPCPICGKMFGGHEWKSGFLMTSVYGGKGVCPDCEDIAEERNKAQYQPITLITETIDIKTK